MADLQLWSRIILVHVWKSIFDRFEHEGRLGAIKAFIYARSISGRGRLNVKFRLTLLCICTSTPSNTHIINQGESALKQAKVMWPSKSTPKMLADLQHNFCFTNVFAFGESLIFNFSTCVEWRAARIASEADGERGSICSAGRWTKRCHIYGSRHRIYSYTNYIFYSGLKDYPKYCLLCKVHNMHTVIIM